MVRAQARGGDNCSDIQLAHPKCSEKNTVIVQTLVEGNTVFRNQLMKTQKADCSLSKYENKEQFFF